MKEEGAVHLTRWFNNFFDTGENMKHHIILAGLSFLCTSGYAATTVQINVGDIPPMSMEVNGAPDGAAIQILQAVEKGGVFKFSYHFLPWQRAQASTLESTADAIIPLTRTPAREDQYRWLAELFSYNFVVVTANGTPAPKSIEEASKLAVGILAGNPAQELLPKLGFTKVFPVTSEEQNGKKLLAKRIDAWVVSDFVAKDLYKRIGGDPASLNFGVRIGEPLHIYMGAAKRFPDSAASAIAKEVERLKADGTVDRIIAKYR